MEISTSSPLTASNDAAGVRLFAPGVTASTESRTLSGPVVQYGVPGRTSRGRLKVRPGALRFPADLTRVKLTKEHDRAASRGHAARVDLLPEGIRASMRVSDGAEGDAALAEAADHTRDGFSFDVIDEVIEGDEITDGLVIAIGQVGIPAYDDMRIDTIAASLHPTEGAPTTMLTPEQRARLAELRAMQTRTAEQETEYQQLVTAAIDASLADPETAGEAATAEATTSTSTSAESAASPAATPAAQPAGQAVAPVTPASQAAPAAQPAGVSASVPAVPGGNPALAAGGALVRPRGVNAFEAMISRLADAFALKKRGGDYLSGITAALNDVVSSDHTSDVEPLAWSGELFAGVDYTPVFSDLLTPGPLTNWKGQGWRFNSIPAMADYAGDKAAIPTGTVGTEESLYEAARAAVGIDIDRKFFDFPNAEFLAALFTAIADTWVELVDTKAGAYIKTEALVAERPVTITTTAGDATVTAAAGTVTATDIGSRIYADNVLAAATVVSITDATHFEISTNALASETVTANMEAVGASLLKAAGRLNQSLKRRHYGYRPASTTGADWLLVNEEDYFGLLDLVEDQLPAYLALFKIDPAMFRSSPDVPSGSVYGGVKRAATLRTEGRSPIAVDALNLANGGIDKAFFGYWAIEEQHPWGVQLANFTSVLGD